LLTVAEKSSGTSSGWEANSGKMEVDAADENEVADKLEELEDNSGIADKLEFQLNEVKAALERIEKGTYGICEVCGKPIEIERLEANPSSRISIKHGHKTPSVGLSGNEILTFLNRLRF
jgi:RNA polymerase-binding transcription factor DksA